MVSLTPFLPHTLLLGSQSASRQMLLTQAQIPFILVAQSADETACDWTLPLPELVATIARIKMDHLLVPSGNQEHDYCFVLTADTLSQDVRGGIQGKPTSREDAIAKIKSARAGSRLSTAFCLDKKIWRKGKWEVAERIEQVVHAEYAFIISDEWIDIYLNNSELAFSASNAIAIEGYGNQFLQTVYGSYSTIIGLPLFELRLALSSLGFFGPSFVVNSEE
jgi:septum formation protein